MSKLPKLNILHLFFVFFLLLYPSEVYAQVSLGTWDVNLHLPFEIASHISESNEDDLFVFGGATSQTNPLKLVGHTDSFGLIDVWGNLSTALPKELFWHSSAKLGSSIYVLGGATTNPLVKSSNVYLGNIVGGDIPVWTILNPLPIPLAIGGAVVSNGYLYYGGGVNNSNQVSDKIYGAKILGDGTLDPWFIAGQFPVGTAGITLLEYGGSIYSIGGFNQVTKVYRFDVSSDGSLSAPVAQPDLIMNYDRGASVRLGNQIFAFAGTTLATAEIDGSGNVGAWTNTGQTIPIGNWCCGTMTATENFVYLIAGFTSGHYTADVMYAPILGDVAPTPTPLPTPTPTPTPKADPDPIVFLPGMGASWNYEAIMHNQPVSNDEWSLNPFVNVYDNLLETLETAGYVMGDNLFVYNYDWRKNISENVSDFKNYLEDMDPVKFDVVGHSMGGLIARGAAASEPSLFDDVVIAGSPQLGSANVYKLWEGGDFTALNMPERIAMELYINTNRRLFDNSVSTVQSLIPALKDVFPTFEFLKNTSGVFKPVSEMTHKNEYLPVTGYENVKTLYGSGTDTVNGFIYVPRDGIDALLGKWVDGRPTENIIADGDDTVTTLSARVNAESYYESSSKHSSLLDGDDNINTVLGALGVNETFSGSPLPVYDSAIVVSIASPATFVVTDPDGQNHSPSEGLLVIYNPAAGEYKVKLTSTAAGNYSLMIGKLTEDDSSWQEIPGVFTKAGKQVEYVSRYADSGVDLGTDPLTDAKKRLDELYSKVVKSNLKPAKKAILIADIKVIKSLVVTLEKNRNKPKYKEIATLLLKTIQVSTKAFPTFAPDLRMIQDLVEEEIQNQL